MHVRSATPGDLPEVLALVRELAAYERAPAEVVFDDAVFAQHLFGPDAVASALLAEADDGTVAGFAVFFRTFSTWLGRSGIWLEDLFVRPAFRRSGAGRALLEAVRQQTDGRVEWAVLDWNTSAQDFYRMLGAQPLDEWTVWRWPPTGRG